MAKLRCMGCMREYEEKKKCCPYCGYVRNTQPQYAFALQPEMILQARYVVGKVLRCGEEEILYLGWDLVLAKRIGIKEYYPQSILQREAGQRQTGLRTPEEADIYEAGKAQYISDARELARFREETGIIRIYDYFEQNGTVYVITEYSENYERTDVATKLLYQKTGHHKKRTYAWRIALAIEITVLLGVLACMLVVWKRPYPYAVATETSQQRMPDVSGELYEQASEELMTLGIQVSKKLYPTQNVTEGMVLSQSEPVGNRISGNTIVTLWVATNAESAGSSEEEKQPEDEKERVDTDSDATENPGKTTEQSADMTTRAAATQTTTAQKATSAGKQNTKSKNDAKTTAAKKEKTTEVTEQVTEQSTEVIVIED